MATPILADARTVQFPQFPHQREQISQQQLTGIIGLRNTITALKASLETAEAEVRAALESGAEIESGVHVASLKENFRRTPAWREIVVRLGNRLYGDGQGEPYCARVLASTKPTRTVSLTVS